MEDAFIETARKIYQNIQDGRWVIRILKWEDMKNLSFRFSLDLNSAETGVQHKPNPPRQLAPGQPGEQKSCACWNILFKTLCWLRKVWVLFWACDKKLLYNSRYAYFIFDTLLLGFSFELFLSLCIWTSNVAHIPNDQANIRFEKIQNFDVML